MNKIFNISMLTLFLFVQITLSHADLIDEKLASKSQYDENEAMLFHSLVLKTFITKYCGGVWSKECFNTNNKFSHNVNVASDRLMYKLVEYCKRFGNSALVTSEKNPARECLNIMSLETADIQFGKERGRSPLFQSKFNREVMKPVLEKTLRTNQGSIQNCVAFAKDREPLLSRQIKYDNEFESVQLSCVNINKRITMVHTYKLKDVQSLNPDSWNKMSETYLKSNCTNANFTDRYNYNFNNLLDYDVSVLVLNSENSISNKLTINLLSCLG